MEHPQRKSNRLPNAIYNQNGTYFVTICTHGRKKILSRIVGTSLPGCPHEPAVKLLWHGEIADEVIHRMDAFYEKVSVDRYVIMPDHIHLLIHIDDPTRHPGRVSLQEHR